MKQHYTKHKNKIIENDSRFKQVMDKTLDPRTDYKEGIIRCITSRKGNIQIKGFVDRSELYKIKGDSFESFRIGERLSIKNEKEIIKQARQSVKGTAYEKDPVGLAVEVFIGLLEAKTDKPEVIMTVAIRVVKQAQEAFSGITLD